MAENSMRLSKSTFIKGLQCHKALWLLKHNPELQDEISPSEQAGFDAGTSVGVLAQSLFPDGVEIPFDDLSPTRQLEMTQEELRKGTPALYEAAFSFNGVFMKADILHKENGGWALYEVKGSTGLKDVYLDDIALQYYVLKGAGLQVAKASLVHINNSYVRKGDIDVHQLFSIQDVTDVVQKKQDEIVEQLASMQTMLKGPMPLIDIGPHCSDPYGCSFSGHCWQHIASPSVFDLCDVGRPDVFELYKQGIIKMADVERKELNWRQQLQYDGTLFQKNVLNIEAIKAFLEGLWYPLAFMDFETTVMTAVPLFDDSRPFQPVPFQYSLHCLDRPDGKLEHFEFLADGTEDPRMAFLDSLLKNMPKDACVLVWNKGFETGILNTLADLYPQKSAKISALVENVVDLMSPFRSKQIYHWKFDGSYSIKKVLPALVPELSYSDLEIQEGGTAAESWMRLRLLDDKNEQQKIRHDLLEYCKLDTFAMVRILQEMQKIIL